MKLRFAITSPPKKDNSMKITIYSSLGFVVALAALGALTGCVGYVDGPRGEVYAPAPSVYVEEGVPVQDDYVYYPAYQVYYSSYRHVYVYQDGRSWVSRPAPPRVAVNVLLSSPSVNVGFHDSPAHHHTEIARQYPQHWSPPGQAGEKHENRGNGHQENR
jgi:hypothetical protein